MVYSGTDFYCDVALAGALELEKEYESDAILAYHHTKPFWPVHIVVVPKRHISSLITVTTDDERDVRELLFVVQTIADMVEKQYGAARVVTNIGAYQDSKHLHVHVSYGDQLRTV